MPPLSRLDFGRFSSTALASLTHTPKAAPFQGYANGLAGYVPR